MAFGGGEIVYNIVDEFDHTFDEKGNTFLAFRKLSWGDGEPKYDLRKWYINKEGQETVGKGVSFLTEEGPHELARVLVSTGFGHTDELVSELVKRDDFKIALNRAVGKDDPLYDDSIKDDEYFDPKELLAV